MAGTNRVSGLLTMNGGGIRGPLTVSNGGTARVTNVTVYGHTQIEAGGVVDWAGYSLQPAAWLTVASNGVLNLLGTAGKYLYSPLTNRGTVTWQEGNLYVYYWTNNSWFGEVRNEPGALFDIQCDRSLEDSG